MKAAVLIAVGEALYGPRWRSQIASDLGVTYRTVRRWLDAGVCPGPVFLKLRVVIRSRIAAAEAARKLLWSEGRDGQA